MIYTYHCRHNRIIATITSQLLDSLLSTLNKHRCLDFQQETAATPGTRRRSPWVRTFLDLYHPTGPWGSSKFSGVPDIYNDTKKNRYPFKTNKIGAIYKNLQNLGENRRSPRHCALYEALSDYFSKFKYYNEFLAACKPIAAVEAMKTPGTRTPFPATAESLSFVTVAASVDRTATVTPENDTADNTTTGNDDHATHHRHCQAIEDFIDVDQHESACTSSILVEEFQVEAEIDTNINESDIRSAIAALMKKDSREVGFAKWGKMWLPVIQLGLYDLPTCEMRTTWMNNNKNVSVCDFLMCTKLINFSTLHICFYICDKLDKQH